MLIIRYIKGLDKQGLLLCNDDTIKRRRETRSMTLQQPTMRQGAKP